MQSTARNRIVGRPKTAGKSAYRRKQRSRRLNLESLERRQLLAADTLQVTVENLSAQSGLLQTPFWIAAHDGNFDVGDRDAAASGFPGLESLAEDGDVAGLVSRFASEGVGNDAVITAPDGFAGAPVFESGETVTADFVVDDTSQSPFFSFASMVIPSNDAFIANLDASALRIFDEAGDFVGTRTIVIYGSDIYDAGTEVNDPAGGAAFASAGGTPTDESGVISSHQGLDDFIGQGLASGDTLGGAFVANTPIARITIAQASNPSGPIDQSGPLTAIAVSDVPQATASHQITVTYSDPSGINLSSISTSNLRVTGPQLTQLDVLSVTTDAADGTTPREVTATYEVAPSSGSFTSLDNGDLSVVLLSDQVDDPFGHAAPEQQLGTFEVAVPVRLNITYENLSEIGGLAQTPVWVASHDGNFEVARAGSPASDFGGLELLAEEGGVSEIVARFANESSGSDTALLAPDGFAGAPVFEPNEVVTDTLDVADPQLNRFFSFASMVIPSNDAFIANLDSRAYELFDLAGNFNGSRTITLYGNDVWDAGTEVNDPAGGAAFSTGGGTSVDENGVIHRHDGLDDFIGTGLPTGANLDAAFSGLTPMGRITISLDGQPTVPIDGDGPTAMADVSDSTIPGQNEHDVTVTYFDPSGVDVSSIDVDDLRVVSSTGTPLVVNSVVTDVAVGQQARTVTATYRIAKEDGSDFSNFDNGLYFVSLVDGQVNDTQANSPGATGLGSFEILQPVQLQITIENLSVDGGLAQTPFWIGLHEGGFRLAQANGSAANYPGLESLAEDGDTSGVSARFATESDGTDITIVAPDGFAGAPVFEPGEVVSAQLDILDTNLNRFLSFASMVIPSNDAFLANLNPRAYEIFDDNGIFTGTQTITLLGNDVWDAGTEVNGTSMGAPFSTLGGDGVDENGFIRRHNGLDEFIGTGLPTGSDLMAAFDSQTPLARITIGLVDGATGPIDEHGPAAAAAPSGIVASAGATEHQFEVTFTDPSGVDTTSVGVDDIRVIGPLGQELVVTNAQFSTNGDASPNSLAVTYTVTTDDGEFTARNNGRYTISTRSGAVTDTLGQGTEFELLEAFNVDVGVRLQIEIENLAGVGGLAQTPFWVGLHDGDFEVARSGVAADQFGGLEQIAETGAASELVARFAAESLGNDTVVTAPDGFAGAPVFEPGEIASEVIEVEDSQLNRYFSFASMIIPSNDAFIANRDSRQYELFDSLGNFKGARQITVYGRDILDAGTEVNDPVGGAAFSTGGGDGVDENLVIRVHDGLDEFVGTGLPTGETLGTAFDGLTPIATITISLFDPAADVCSGVARSCSVQSVSLQNSSLTADVNLDGEVSPLDALLVINFLGSFGNTGTIADEAQATGLALDVGGDFEITPVDALTVINEISRLAGSASGESESAAATDAAFAELSVGGDFLSPSLSEDDEGTLLRDSNLF